MRTAIEAPLFLSVAASRSAVSPRTRVSHSGCRNRRNLRSASTNGRLCRSTTSASGRRRSSRSGLAPVCVTPRVGVDVDVVVRAIDLNHRAARVVVVRRRPARASRGWYAPSVPDGCASSHDRRARANPRFRLGRAIRQSGVRPRRTRGPDRGLDVLPQGRLLRRRRREVLRDPEERARQPPQLAVAARAPIGSVRVHRGVLQPPASALVKLPDADLGPWDRAYRGANLDRLLRVKAHYDPDDTLAASPG